MNEIVTAEKMQGSSPEMFGFEKNDVVKTLPLEKLSKSVRVEGKHGRVLSTRPEQSWKVISFIIAMLEENNMNYDLKDIYVQKKSSYPRINDQDRDKGYNRESCPIEKWEFDKVICRIDIPNLSNGDSTSTIGITFNDRGIQVAFGANINICSNFQVLGGRVLSTYKRSGNEGMSWDNIMIRLQHWVQSMEQLFKVETDVMNRMKESGISDERTIEKVIGDLYMRAIDQAYGSKKIAPFDTHEMSQFVQEMFRQRKEEEKISTVWDIYNWGTSILKPGKADIGEIVESSQLFGDYLCLEFGIDREDLIEEAEVI